MSAVISSTFATISASASASPLVTTKTKKHRTKHAKVVKTSPSSSAGVVEGVPSVTESSSYAHDTKTIYVTKTAEANASAGGPSASPSAGAIAGIAIGVILGLALLLGLVYFILRRRRSKGMSESEPESPKLPSSSSTGNIIAVEKHSRDVSEKEVIVGVYEAYDTQQSQPPNQEVSSKDAPPRSVYEMEASVPELGEMEGSPPAINQSALRDSTLSLPTSELAARNIMERGRPVRKKDEG